MILEAVPALPANGGTGIKSSNGRHATMPRPCGDPEDVHVAGVGLDDEQAVQPP